MSLERRPEIVSAAFQRVQRDMPRTDRLAHEDGIHAFVGLTMGLTVAVRGIESEVLGHRLVGADLAQALARDLLLGDLSSGDVGFGAGRGFLIYRPGDGAGIILFGQRSCAWQRTRYRRQEASESQPGLEEIPAQSSFVPLATLLTGRTR
jgi:hypothetical protein